ncbi:MAG: hypothetical protein MJ147_07775 [Clostridia bacterium]|nr:hypothetical protein [Clostridia bacterium]
MKKVICIFLCIAMLFAFASCKGKNIKEEKKENIFCEADNGMLTVLSLDSASGIFVEKGNQDNVKGVATIIVRNNSKQMLEYGKIVFRVNDIERAEFIVNGLPAGEQCVVMETTARPLEKDDVYKINIDDSMFSYCDASTESEKYTLNVEGSTIKVTNNTDAPLTVRVAYKYYKDNRYYGGICFRGSFEKIAPGKTMEKTSNRFNGNCKIVSITTE